MIPKERKVIKMNKQLMEQFYGHLDMTEMANLIVGLTMRGVPFKVRSFQGGLQVYDPNFEWDVICHWNSYGHKDGLLETMGKYNRNPDDDVEGWLTAEDLLIRFDEEEQNEG